MVMKILHILYKQLRAVSWACFEIGFTAKSISPPTSNPLINAFMITIFILRNSIPEHFLIYDQFRFAQKSEIP